MGEHARCPEGTEGAQTPPIPQPVLGRSRSSSHRKRGRNLQTDFELEINEIQSYDFPNNEKILDWVIENISIGKPIPETYFDRWLRQI